MEWTCCKQPAHDTFPKPKGLCKVWVLLLRHHLHPQVQQHSHRALGQQVTHACGQSCPHLLLARVHGCVPICSQTTAIGLWPISQPLNPCFSLLWYQLSTKTTTNHWHFTYTSKIHTKEKSTKMQETENGAVSFQEVCLALAGEEGRQRTDRQTWWHIWVSFQRFSHKQSEHL